MHRRALAALTATTVTVLGLSGATSGSAYADPLPPPDRHALAESISGLPDDAVTGAQARVSGPAGRWSGKAGVRDVRTERPVPADARFGVGSATKMFTASLVLQLAAEGRLGLDDPVQRWLPGELPASYPTVTVGQLLDHTSGLPKSTEDAGHDDPAWVVRHRFDWHTPRAVVRSATRQPMAFAPGTRQEYNGVNYFLAGWSSSGSPGTPTPVSCAPGCSSRWASTTPTFPGAARCGFADHTPTATCGCTADWST
jgi:D-alanyl-D-alanine carboxypeptidase